MDGNKVGKYGDFHMLPSIVKYDRTHPVQLTASNLALPLKMSPGEKRQKTPAWVTTASATNGNTRACRACQDRPGRDIPSDQRERKKSFGSGWLRTPRFLVGRRAERCVTAILDLTCYLCNKKSTWLFGHGYIPLWEGRRSELCRIVASLFYSTGRGTVGKVGLGAGRRYQEGKGSKRGKELNTTQHNENRSHQSTATSTCTYMWKPRDTTRH